MTMVLSGDGTITGLVPGGLPTATILYEDLQQVTAGKVLGRNTSGAGVVQELPIAVDSGGNVSFSGSNNAITATLANSSGANYLKATNGTVEARFGVTGSNVGALMTISAHDLVFGTDGGVERGRFDTSGNFKFNSGYGSVATAYGCRAWVNFNGSGGGIRASGNVSSITVNGTGDYWMNFSSGMPDINYALSGTIGRQITASVADRGYVYQNPLSNLETGRVRLAVTEQNSMTNATTVCAVIHR